ncbi:MAG: acylneuraminate cytidylyltransferase family protein [Hydrogenothermus sp.]|nr:MAG: acylneuraminate cytidylyltransferase family protein [Hydrogenothermus sp.]
MIENQKVIALIPARGGSKGIKEKNIKPLAGKPLILWTIEEAQKSKYIDEIYVSTDSRKIKDVVKTAKVNIVDRPKELATDEAKTIDVVIHFIKHLESRNYKENFLIILLQPTSPLRTVEDIDKALEMYFRFKVPIVSVSKACHPPQWIAELDEDLGISNFLKAISCYQRQKSGKVYQLNGAIYIADKKTIKKEKSFLTLGTKAFIMSKERSIDIDDEFDFKIADLLLREKLI